MTNTTPIHPIMIHANRELQLANASEKEKELVNKCLEQLIKISDSLSGSVAAMYKKFISSYSEQSREEISENSVFYDIKQILSECESDEFNKLLKWVSLLFNESILTPLTGNDDEWEIINHDKYTDKMDEFRNIRLRNVFKRIDGTAYIYRGRFFGEINKNFSSIGMYSRWGASNVNIDFPYTPINHDIVYYDMTHGIRLPNTITPNELAKLKYLGNLLGQPHWSDSLYHEWIMLTENEVSCALKIYNAIKKYNWSDRHSLTVDYEIDKDPAITESNRLKYSYAMMGNRIWAMTLDKKEISEKTYLGTDGLTYRLIPHKVYFPANDGKSWVRDSMNRYIWMLCNENLIHGECRVYAVKSAMNTISISLNDHVDTDEILRQYRNDNNIPNCVPEPRSITPAIDSDESIS